MIDEIKEQLIGIRKQMTLEKISGLTGIKVTRVFRLFDNKINTLTLDELQKFSDCGLIVIEKVDREEIKFLMREVEQVKTKNQIAVETLGYYRFGDNKAEQTCRMLAAH